MLKDKFLMPSLVGTHEIMLHLIIKIPSSFASFGSQSASQFYCWLVCFRGSPVLMPSLGSSAAILK
jgi:hypothetical protein